MTFRIGQKVVCIFDPIVPPGCPFPVFKKDVVYTVAEITPYGTETFVGVRELHPSVVGEISGFRPVVEGGADISVFTEILRKATAPAREGADA